MANRVALYLAQNGASVYMRFLLSSFAALCSMLMIYGIGVTVMCGILIALALDDKQGPPVQPGGAELQLWYLCIMLGFLGVGRCAVFSRVSVGRVLLANPSRDPSATAACAAFSFSMPAC